MSAVVEFNQSRSLVMRMAERFGVDPDKFLTTLKATAFQTDRAITNEQMMALLVVAEQYRLNPFTKEIYAFPDKYKGIVPIVSVDGWTRIINEHPQMNGIEFAYSEQIATPVDGKPCPEWVECSIYRKDRDRPITLREYLDEVYRPPFESTGKDGKSKYKVNGPWQTHTKRFLRHKTVIQCARLAFGFAGIYDQDEAERIIEGHLEQEPILVTATRVDPRGDTSMVSDLDEMQHVAAIKDLLSQDKDEYGIAEDLRAYEIQHLTPFNERYIRVADALADQKVISKANWKKFLKIGLDRGESHTA